MLLIGLLAVGVAVGPVCCCLVCLVGFALARFAVLIDLLRLVFAGHFFVVGWFAWLSLARFVVGWFAVGWFCC